MSKKDERQKDKIVIEFTEELLEQWTKIYFKKHPRARKKPIETPAQPSLNKWIILRRMMMNKLKQDYKDFTKFVVEYYGLEDLGISKCKCRYVTYRATKRRIDCDNTVPKFILDGLTAECTGVLVDDSVDCIEELTLIFEYTKCKGARIEFYDCEYDVDLMQETREKELVRIAKKEATMEQKKEEKKEQKKTTRKRKTSTKAKK
nr:MAG TPA: hypothetical protein [Caudoviricetes sp.]